MTGQPVTEVQPPTPPPATLPPTGGGTQTPVQIAVWLVLLGGVMVLWTARRRSTDDPTS